VERKNVKNIQRLIFISMSTATKQNLSLGKLGRAVSGSRSNYTTETSMGSVAGTRAVNSNINFSDFSISSVDSMTGYAYLWEQTSEDYLLTFSNRGTRFDTKVAKVAGNFTWSINAAGATITNNGATGSVAAAAISNANTGTGADDDWFAAGTNNLSRTLSATFHEDGQSDGYNDHATNYNTARTKAITIVDSYGGSNPSCLLEGTPIDMADGTTKKVEDLIIGDWIMSMNMPGQLDEDNEEWRGCRFADEKTETFTQHSASVQDINFDFVQNYWNINNGEETITGDHEMLYKPVGENTWMWNLVPNMLVGGNLMDKNGEEVLITQLENVVSEEGFEVVQIDVEPLDVYFGRTFLVHNKGSNDDPFA
jgi:hypothetical protein